MSLSIALDRALSVLNLPEPLSVSEHSSRYRYLSSESSSSPGKFVPLPFQIEPMDSAGREDVQSWCLMWSSQTAGKTEVIGNICFYHMEHEPSPILIVQPTVDMAEAWSKDRLAPMIRDCPRLKGKLFDVKSRDSGNTILHKVFPGGHISAVGANAPAGLAGRPVRVVICDEVDRYPASAGTEGDPVALAQKRAEAFPDAIFLLTSTPTIKGASRIEAEFNLSDKRYWFVACPHCKHEQTLQWGQVRWPKDQPEEAQYQCVECDMAWTEHARLDAITAGKWVATAPFKGKRGYHLNGLYCLFKPHKGFRNRLHEAAVGFIDATAKGEGTLRVWTNTFLAETWEVAGEQPEPEPLLKRCEAYGPGLPAEVLVLTAGIDVQHDRLEAEVVGWGMGEESRGIATGVSLANQDGDEVWQSVENFLTQEWEHPSGSKLRVAAACFDSGTKPKAVYTFTKPRQVRRWYSVKGSAVANAPLVARPKKSSIKRATLLMIGTDTAKEILYGRMAIAEPGPRYMHFPIGYGYTEEFFKGLTAEKITTIYKRGFPSRVWVKVRARNEPLDCRVYSLAALELLNVNWTALAKSLTLPDKVDQPATTDKPPEPDKPPPMRRRRVSGWVNKWR